MKGQKNINQGQSIFVRISLIVFASLVFTLNINTFVHSGSLLPGGFSGVALLIQNSVLKFFNITLPYSLLLYIFNIFPIYIGFRYIGKKFTLLSCLLIVLSGILTDLYPKVIPKFVFTDDLILCAVFGGMLNALAISLCLFAESSSGGTDFIAIYISEKTGKTAWNIVLFFNCMVLVVSGFLISWESALYSIIFQYVSTQAINFLYKKYSKTTLLVITEKSREISEFISSQTGHGSTVFSGKSYYSGKEKFLLYSVVSDSETGQLEKGIRMIDPDAFVNVLQSKEILGKFFKRHID